MARISSSFSTGNWKTRTTMMTSLGMGTTHPQKRRKTMSRLRRTRRQGVSCMPGHPTKMMTETTAGTPTTESIVMTAPLVTTALESDGGSGDGDVGASPPIKCRRFLDTY
jgi:hypothetical protein